MNKRFKRGDRVKLTDEAKQNECYAKFRDKTLTVERVATAYMPASKFYAAGKPDGFHPGFDDTGSALYDLKGVPCSLYDWELSGASTPIPNCPLCNGEREFDGNGGYTCFFCGTGTPCNS